MRYDPKDMKTELDAAIRDGNDVQLAWVLVKIVRHGRLRCRNNKALYNWMAQAFPELSFDEVQKEYQGRRYPGLRITERNTGEAIETGELDDD